MRFILKSAAVAVFYLALGGALVDFGWPADRAARVTLNAMFIYFAFEAGWWLRGLTNQEG